MGTQELKLSGLSLIGDENVTPAGFASAIPTSIPASKSRAKHSRRQTGFPHRHLHHFADQLAGPGDAPDAP